MKTLDAVPVEWTSRLLSKDAGGDSLETTEEWSKAGYPWQPLAGDHRAKETTTDPKRLDVEQWSESTGSKSRHCKRFPTQRLTDRGGVIASVQVPCVTERMD